LILSSEFERTLRRLKPDKQHQQLTPRSDVKLTFLDFKSGRWQSLLYDTTVYIDILQGRFPDSGEPLLRAADAWHSSVAESELAWTCGLLDPAHPDTKGVINQIAGIINRISPHRCLAPDRQVWHEAGILTGTIARIQGISKPDRRRILNDALIFATARKYGHTVLTRNTTDFDLLQQLDPSGRIVFYRLE
jgi:predicted nucleic acid-binding protein